MTSFYAPTVGIYLWYSSSWRGINVMSPGQAKLEFPATCPSCGHSPLEADACSPSETHRNTMRTWVVKQKKKDDTKAASQAVTPAVEATPVPAEAQPADDAADRPADGVEDISKAEGGAAKQTAADDSGEANQLAGSAASEPHGVSNSRCGCRTHCSVFTTRTSSNLA